MTKKDSALSIVTRDQDLGSEATINKFSNALKMVMATLVLYMYSNCGMAASNDSVFFGPGINLVGNHGYFAKSSSWATSKGMDYYLSRGIRVFRIVFAWEWIQPLIDGPLDEITLSGLDNDVDYVTAAGAYAIVDMHNFGRRDLNYNKSPPNIQIIGQYNGITAANISDAWKKIAAHYTNKNNVIFELMNEPHDQDSKSLVITYNEVIASIRSTGARNMIMIDGNDWSNGGRWTINEDNSVNMLNVVDPLNNIIFDIHQYFDNYSAGQSESCNQGSGSSLYKVTTWARKNKRRLFLGEFSGGQNPQCYTEIKNTLGILQDNRDVWKGFAWWAAYAGQAAYNNPDTSFWYSIDPGAGGNQDFSGALPEDPRMSILRKYLH